MRKLIRNGAPIRAPNDRAEQNETAVRMSPGPAESHLVGWVVALQWGTSLIRSPPVRGSLWPQGSRLSILILYDYVNMQLYSPISIWALLGARGGSAGLSTASTYICMPIMANWHENRVSICSQITCKITNSQFTVVICANACRTVKLVI